MSTKNFIEVCSGGGGLGLGFILAGFKPILMNDNDKCCVKTLRLNHPDVEIFEGNMMDIDLKKYKDENIDLLFGGVPCQSFSQAGKRKGIEDDRGKLLLYFIEMIDILNPKVFLIENVKGLISHDKGKTLLFILEELKKSEKYDVYYKVLNANNYSVPQNRERLIIIGVRRNLNKEFKFPEKHNYKPVLKDVLTNCPESSGIEYKKEKLELIKLIPQGGCWTSLPIEIQKSYLGKSYYSSGGKRGILKRLDMNKPCLTLLCSPSQKQTERIHPIKDRPLQLLEYSRIQTFPDDYKFFGSMNQIYRQIGNAVPVNFAKTIAEAIMKILD